MKKKEFIEKIQELDWDQKNFFILSRRCPFSTWIERRNRRY